MDRDEGVHPAEKGNGTAGCKEAGRADELVWQQIMLVEGGTCRG